MDMKYIDFLKKINNKISKCIDRIIKIKKYTEAAGSSKVYDQMELDCNQVLNSLNEMKKEVITSRDGHFLDDSFLFKDQMIDTFLCNYNDDETFEKVSLSFNLVGSSVKVLTECPQTMSNPHSSGLKVSLVNHAISGTNLFCESIEFCGVIITCGIVFNEGTLISISRGNKRLTFTVSEDAFGKGCGVVIAKIGKVELMDRKKEKLWVKEVEGGIITNCLNTF